MSVPEVWVDFNCIHKIGHTTTLRRFARAPSEVVAGAKVVPRDHDRNACDAEVVAVAGDVIDLALDLSTFRDDA